jgi:hypothetical protein
MRLRAAFLAQDAVQNQDGTFMVWRGGINKFQATSFPAPFRLFLILRLEAEGEEARSLHRLGLRVVHAGREYPWQESPIAFKEPEPPDPHSYLNLLANLNLVLDSPGMGRVELLIDEEGIIPGLPFQVEQIPFPPGFPRSPDADS